MPGLLENTIHQGYGYLEQSGYVDKARPYVERARNIVPLLDPLAKKAEEIVPPLITRADELAEPGIERMRPYVEPRIEQVKEIATPYVNKGVENYIVLRNAGLEQVDKIKEFKDAKTSQIKGFTEAKATQVMELKDEKVAQIRELADPQIEKIRELAEPQMERIKGAVEPTTSKVGAAIKCKKIQAQKLLRVPKSVDLQGLKYETLLGKVASLLEQAEGLVDKYLPLPEPDQDSDSDKSAVSSASDSSYLKINRSLASIKSHVICAFMVKVQMLMSFPGLFKAAYVDGTLKEKSVKYVTDTKFIIMEHFGEHFATLNRKAEPLLKLVAQNSLFKKALKTAVAGSEKILGKERTAAVLVKIESYIPSTKIEDKPVAEGEQNGTTKAETTLRNRAGNKGTANN